MREVTTRWWLEPTAVTLVDAEGAVGWKGKSKVPGVPESGRVVHPNLSLTRLK